MCPRVYFIQFPPYRTQLLMQIDHKILYWKGLAALTQLVYLSYAHRPLHASMHSAVKHFLQEGLRATSACTFFLSKTLFLQVEG